MRCRIKGSKATCKVNAVTAFVKSTTTIDKSKATIDKSKATIDKSKAMILVFQGKYDYILGKEGEKGRSGRDLDGM